MYRETMSFNEYQDWNVNNNPGRYPLKGANVVYPAIGLAGEAGELLDKIKKHWRNAYTSGAGPVLTMSAKSLSEEQVKAITLEMGDVLWYLHIMCRELGISLSSVAFDNVQKIKDRIERGQHMGEGDNR